MALAFTSSSVRIRLPIAALAASFALLVADASTQSPPVRDDFGEVPVQVTPRGFQQGPLMPVPPAVLLRRPNEHTLPRPPVGPANGIPRPGDPPSRVIDVGQQPPGTGQFTYFYNRPVTPSGINTSNIPEPSVAQNRDTVWQTGNSHAALSRDSGYSWTAIAPATFFPTNPDGGFCCDQRVEHVRSHDMTVWQLQYWYSSATQQNTYRIAVANGRDALRSGNSSDWVWYDFTPATFGYGLTNWMDFPDVSVSDDWFHVSCNVFQRDAAGNNNFVEALRWRMELDDMQAGRAVTISYKGGVALGGGASYRFANGGNGSKMYWGDWINTTTVRIWELDEATATSTSVDRSVASFSNATATCPGPDGLDWPGNAVGRMRGAYGTSSELGFIWTSGTSTSLGRPQPYLRVSRFRSSDRTLISDHDIWSQTLCFAFGAGDSNTLNDVGLVAAIGSSTSFVHSSATIIDSYQPWGTGLTFVSMRSGTSGPSQNRWGDYFDVQRSWIDQRTFIGTGSVQIGGGGSGSNEPRFAWFGRDDYTPTWVTLNVNSTPVPGIPITVDEADRFGLSSGTTNLTRSYPPNQGYTLTAPSTHSAGSSLYGFDRWRINGLSQPAGSTTVTVSNIGSADDTAEAGYLFAPSLTVDSNHAAVSIGVSPADLLGRATSSTQFVRNYVPGSTVFLTAPAMHGGVPFKGWLVNGVPDPSLTTTLSFTATSTASAQYFVYTPGTYTPYGPGCPGTGGVVPLHTGFGTPELGMPTTFRLSQARPNSGSVLYVGFSRTMLPNGTPLPLSLAFLGMNGCFLRQSANIPINLPVDATGRASFTWNIPNIASFIGGHLYSEFAVADPGAPTPLKVVHSNALDTRIGGLQ